MKERNIDAVIELGGGVTLLFMAWCLSKVSTGGGDNFCIGVPLLIGIGLVIASLRTEECFLTRLQRLAFIPIWTGITSLLFVWLLSKQTALPPNKRMMPYWVNSFSGDFHFTTGILLIIVGGIAFWLVSSPPNLNKFTKKVKETNILSGNNDYKPSYLGLTRSETEAPSGDVIDQALWDIMNADTNLRSMMNANPDLSGKIQKTFDYYNPEAGVFGSWAGRLRGDGRAKLLEVLNQEQKLLIEQAAMFEQQVLDGTRKQADYKLFLAKNMLELYGLKSQAKLNQQAFGKGMFAEDLSEVNKEEELRKIREKEQETKARIEREQEEARVKRNLDSAKQYKMQEDDITDDLRKRMEKALLELDAIDARTDLSERSKAALAIAKQNEIDNFSRRIIAREKKAQSDEESFA